MSKKIEGKCSICGEISILTYEHIPPKSEFLINSSPTFGYDPMKNYLILKVINLAVE